MEAQNIFFSLTPTVFWIVSSVFMAARYFLFAGLAFWIFYKLFRSRFKSRKIQTTFPKSGQLRNEIASSLRTIFVFACFAVLIRFMRQNELTLMYEEITRFSVAYFVFSVFLILILHDAYFYWMHYAMHRQPWLMQFHAHHHKSYNPTPFTALSFHLAEAVLELVFFPLIILLLPIHPIALAIAGTFSLIFNIIGHTGYEIFKSGFLEKPLLRWLNTPTHHNMHHRLGNGNYGLYFNFWDTVMKTNFKNYRRDFERIAAAQKNAQ